METWREDEPGRTGGSRPGHSDAAAQLRRRPHRRPSRDPDQGRLRLLRRATELRDALITWTDNGHSASLVTITVPHDLDDALSKLVGAERHAWKRITAGAAWQRLKHKLGIAGHSIEQNLLDDDQYDYGNQCLMKLLGFSARHGGRI